MRRIQAMGSNRAVSARPPWIGSIRRECLDHVVVVSERNLPHVLASYQTCYNEVRTRLSLQKDAPIRRDVCRTGRVGSSPILAATPSICSSLSFRHGPGTDDPHPAAVTPRASVARRDSPSQRRMACPSADRGLWLGQSSAPPGCNGSLKSLAVSGALEWIGLGQPLGRLVAAPKHVCLSASPGFAQSGANGLK
jgi:hypothetical protein